ncbi:penicillin-binding protein 1A [Thermodesulfobacteriota bacterium]
MARSIYPRKTRQRRPAKRKRGAFRILIRWLAYSIIALMVVAGASGAVVFLYITRDLPKISSLKDYRPPVVTTVHAQDRRKISEFFKERRIVVPLSRIPDIMKQAFIAAEDSRFYKHPGIDLVGIIRALFKNIEAGAIVQGGSTITQQVTKSFLLSPERSYRRKIREAILAYRIDRAFTKDEILFLYLNQIYLGHGAYGVEAASQTYFGKSATECTLAECALLAGLPQAPSRYSPIRRPDMARERKIYVLLRMQAEGYISNIEATEAINAPVEITPRSNYYVEQVPYYTEHVRRYVLERYGSDMLYTGGLTIHTAVDIDLQRAGRGAIAAGLRALDKRQGYRGPLKHIPAEEIEQFSQDLRKESEEQPLESGKISRGVVVSVDDAGGVVTVRMANEQGIIPTKSLAWARKPDPEVAYYETGVRRPSQVLSVGDVILVRLMEKKEKEKQWVLALEQEPAVQAALLCLETETGYVRAMIGGRDFRKSQFNRAVQSRRQPGSAFKPVIYGAALDKEYTPATVIIDSPVVLSGSDTDLAWKPRNYEERFHGPTLFREALTRSRNVITVKILQDIGIDYVISYARKLGVTSPLARDLSIALGSSGISLLEAVTAYSVFANEGFLIQPCFVTQILDRDGNVLEEHEPKAEKAVDKNTAYITTNLLQGVVENGTGWRVKALKRPAAGKTGTTNNLHDAWFVGYTPRYVTGVWVGFDEERPLGKGETGSRAASPIWLDFMQKVLADKTIRIFPVPEGVVFAKIDAETGLLAIPESRRAVFECFKEGTAPTQYTERPGIVSDPGQLFKFDM